MRFSKAHAYGNDFLYVEQSSVGGGALDALAREMCDRHTGIGADGLIVYRATTSGATMTLFNSDGSRAEVSGNGVRGLAALLLRQDDREGATVTIETEGGAKRLTRIAQSVPGTCLTPVFQAAMGLPADIRQITLTAAGESVMAIALNFGNPQCVVLGALPARPQFEALGAALERHATFPAGTNVEFASVEAPDTIRILIWERGVGPTQSSGTGSCASLVAAASFGGARREATVIAPGGAQHVEWRADNVYLTGAAEILFDGEWLRQIPRTG
ncbi:MAG TPA: diaminopimelate epimerase [Vicinamibacterales bacterium]|jgi:diaminopimelate epimerase